MLNRREFLAAAGMLLLQACTKLPVPLSGGRRARYFVPSPGVYIRKAQDFSSIKFDTILRYPKIPDTAMSLVTAVNDDGSDVRRIHVPGFIHAVHANPDFLYLVSVDYHSVLHQVDAKSLQLVNTLTAKKGSEFIFGGHIVNLPDGKHFAVTMNGFTMGKFDAVSIRERATLKEVARIPSYGFEAHDISLSNDGKAVFVAHYGSYLGSGPYSGIVSGGSYSSKQYPKFYYDTIYPAATSVVELATGKLLDRRSYQFNGAQQGHIAVGHDNQLYIACDPPLVRARPDSLTHPAFSEGPRKPEWSAGFVARAKGAFGTTVAYDSDKRQVLIPARYEDKMLYADAANPDNLKNFDLHQYAPDITMPHALGFHPDGKHYVVSADNWILAFERGTHRHVKEMSFPLRLFTHSHLAVV